MLVKNNGEKREKPDEAEGETLLDPLMVFLMVIGELVPVMELENSGHNSCLQKVKLLETWQK